jgi:vitamin B12 transporter
MRVRMIIRKLIKMKSLSYKLQPAVLVCALVAAVCAQAQSRADAPELSPITTVAKREQNVYVAPASVQVITRADIERLQAVDSVSLLRHVAGVDLSRTGGPGSSTSVFLRGTNSNHVLVLIDGVRVSSANTGAYAFEGLPVELIERIEIVRGPMAALYGSDAIGGVIQIFTRTPKSIHAELGIARFDSFHAQASVGMTGARGGAGASVSRRGSQGFSAQNANGFGFNPDRDGTYSERALLHANAELSEDFTIRANAVRAVTDVEFDQGRSDLLQQLIAVQAVRGNIAGYQQTLRLGYSRDDLQTPVFQSRFQSKRIQADWQHDLSLSTSAHLTAGLNAAREEGSEGPKARRLIAPFVRVEKSLGALAASASVRFDDDSQFGSKTSASTGLNYQQEQWRWYTNFGQGFRAPNWNELYSPGFDGLFAGNPLLAPERSYSGEFGVDFNWTENRQISMRAYRTRVRDLISFSGNQSFQAININRVAIDGVELEMRQSLGACTFAGDITLQDPRNLRDDSVLLRRAKRKAGLHADCAGERFDFGIDGFGYSRRADFGAELPGYGLMDLRTSVKLSDALALQIKVENIFDRNYELARGFNTPARTWSLSLRFEPSVN